MTFLNPLLLLALAAVAIPIVVHLFHFRRPRRVDFSSIRFVRVLEKSATRRLKLRQWLLLALRLLAVVCLVLAFARPRAESAWAGVLGERPRASIAVVVDNSLTMTRTDTGGRLLDQAKALASSLAGSMQPGDELFVLTSSGGGGGDPFTRSAAALDAIAEIEAAPRRGSLLDALGRARTVLEDAVHIHREVFLISDLQEAAVMDSTTAAFPPDLHVSLVPVGSGASPNVGVSSVEVGSRVIEAGRPVRLSATLRSNVASANTPAAAFLEGERVAQATADIPLSGIGRVDFSFTPRGQGWLAGSVQVDSDGFEFDNVRHFVLHVPGTRRVLLVEGPQSGAQRLELALTLGRGDGPFLVNRIGEAAFGGAEHAAYDAIVLAGPSSLSSGEAAALNRFVAQGGGLIIFPAVGEQAGVNAALGAIGGGRVQGVAQGTDRFGQVDFDQAIFEGMLDRRAGEELESPDILRAASYLPGSGAESAAVRLASGRPFLQEIRHGSGVAFFFAVGAAPVWGDFSERGVFVPLLHRAVLVASATPPVDDELLAGAPATVRVPGAGGGVRVTIDGGEGMEIVPETRVVPGGLLLDFTAPEAPGVYTIRQGDRILRRVAVNLDPRESALETVSPREAAAALATQSGLDVRVVPSPDLSRPAAAERAGYGAELWRAFLLAALLLLVAEMVVAARWRSTTA